MLKLSPLGSASLRYAASYDCSYDHRSFDHRLRHVAWHPNPTVAREAVFSVVMIVCTGLIGTCLTLGALRNHEQEIRQQGTSAYLGVLFTLAALTLILPDYTLTGTPGSFLPGATHFHQHTVGPVIFGVLVYPDRASSRLLRRIPTRKEPGSSVHRRAIRSRHSAERCQSSRRPCRHRDPCESRSLRELKMASQRSTSSRLMRSSAPSLLSWSCCRKRLSPYARRCAMNCSAASMLLWVQLWQPSGSQFLAVAAISLITGNDLTLGLGGGDIVLLTLTMILQHH